MLERSGERKKQSNVLAKAVGVAKNLETGNGQINLICSSTDLILASLIPYTPEYRPAGIPVERTLDTAHPLPQAIQDSNCTLLTPLNSTPHSPLRLSLTADQLRNELRKSKARKARGPDGISSRLLKDQLYKGFLHIFNQSSNHIFKEQE